MSVVLRPAAARAACVVHALHYILVEYNVKVVADFGWDIEAGTRFALEPTA